jgi:hypothetical protein
MTTMLALNEVAQILDRSNQTLANWRRRGVLIVDACDPVGRPMFSRAQIDRLAKTILPRHKAAPMMQPFKVTTSNIGDAVDTYVSSLEKAQRLERELVVEIARLELPLVPLRLHLEQVRGEIRGRLDAMASQREASNQRDIEAAKAAAKAGKPIVQAPVYRLPVMPQPTPATPAEPSAPKLLDGADFDRWRELEGMLHVAHELAKNNDDPAYEMKPFITADTTTATRERLDYLEQWKVDSDRAEAEEADAEAYAAFMREQEEQNE